MASTGFGTKFVDEMTIASYQDGKWGSFVFQPSNQLTIHPAAHILHYSSTCFEGLKAFKTKSGELFIFRIDDHIHRMQRSAKNLSLPVPDFQLLKSMIISLLEKYKYQAPDFPSSFYIRPTLIGTDPAIGKAANPSASALLYILISPVGDYFSLDSKMRVLLDIKNMRCAPHMGNTKSGGNYASALSIILKAKKEYNADQVIFAPNGDVQETGAANCLLISDKQLVTKACDESFLSGITRDSIIKVADHLGYSILERDIDYKELLDWTSAGEVSLSGTAAVLAPVSEVLFQDKIYLVNKGKPFANTLKIRDYLNSIQQGETEDLFSWMTKI